MTDETLPPEEPFEFEKEQDEELAGLPPDEADAAIEETLEDSPMHDLGEVGILDEDPNIVGEVGPTDVPPGEDPPEPAEAPIP
ncbi:MAG: hypothetical protein QOG03_1906 [Actinomycetota bacterium]|nr:hypothetical protein [Actinomycetota bacterium]